MRSRNAMPERKPTTAGTICGAELVSLLNSSAGMSSDHTDAATITPDANPSSAFCTMAFISCRMKNTNAEPTTVPMNGTRRPNVIPFIIC